MSNMYQAIDKLDNERYFDIDVFYCIIYLIDKC